MKKYMIILACAASLIGCKDKETVKQEEIRTVKYEVVEEKSSELKRNFSGVVEADVESLLSFRVEGTIDRQYVDYGSKVQKGDVLAYLDAADYRVKYKSSLAKLEKTKAIMVRDSADFQRIQKLYFNDNVSRAEYDTSLALLESSKAEVQAAKEQVEFDRLRLGYTKLVAPVSGTIVQEFTDEGETVAQGVPVYKISAEGDLKVEFYVPESIITKIKLNDMVDIIVDTGEKNKLKGKITQVGDVSTGFGRTFPVKVNLLDPQKNIKSGMTAQVKLNVDFTNSKSVFMLPIDSVMEDEDHIKYVYLVDGISEGIGSVKRRNVSTGKATSNGIEITKGLLGGEKIITVGVSKTETGKKVRLPNKEGR